jgi:hypothetical protein
MNREQAIPYIGYCVDDALSEHNVADLILPLPSNVKLVGWQCGFEPLFVAVWSYLDVPLNDQEAEELAIDLLTEKKWFADADADATNEPDYIL